MSNETKSKDELERLYYVGQLDSSVESSLYEWQALGTTNYPLYIGTAPAGTLAGSPTWKIQRFTYVAGPAGDYVISSISTAIGSWANRASLSY